MACRDTGTAGGSDQRRDSRRQPDCDTVVRAGADDPSAAQLLHRFTGRQRPSHRSVTQPGNTLSISLLSRQRPLSLFIADFFR